jgi:putative transcriptional regulator
MQSYKGHLLVASPKMLDPNFSRSVVLLIQHDEGGAFGIVLNRPSPHRMRDVWERVSEQPCPSEEQLHIGGPIEGPLMALHTRSPLAECEVVPGVHFSARKEAIEELVTHSGEPFRLFAGYAGWGPGQLESELAEGAWLTWPARAELVFDEAASLWQRAAKELSEDVVFSSLKIKHRPADPSAN